MTDTSRRWIARVVGVMAVLALMRVVSATVQPTDEARTARAARDLVGGCTPPDDRSASDRRRPVLPSPPELPAPPEPVVGEAAAAGEGGARSDAPEPIVDTAVVPVPVRVVELDERYVLPGSGEGGGDPVGPVVSPQGTWIAWEEPGGAGPGLHAAGLSVTGFGPPLQVPVPDLGRRAAEHWRRPAWTPEGTLLFEAASADGTERLYGAAPGAASAELISAADQPGRLGGAAASPDGSWLAFVADTHGNGDIRLRAPSGAILGVSVTDASEDRPRFDAVGRRLTYERDGRDVVVADLATRRERAVLGGPGSRLRPVFAGDRVVFFRQAPGAGAWSLVSAADDGGDDRVLATGVRLPRLAAPAVSPDGRWVAVTWAELNRNDVITLVHVGSGIAVDVRTGMSDVDEPVLGEREGQWIVAFTARERADAGARVLVVGLIDDL